MISNKKNDFTNFENLFPYFMETVEDLIIIASSDNSLEIEHVYKSKFLEQLGYSSSILTGKSLLDLVDFGDGIRKEDVKKIIKQNRSRQDVQVINKNGHFIWAELNSTTFNDDKNQQKLIITLRNISKRKEFESKLEELELRFWEASTSKKYEITKQKIKESEEKYRDIAELLPDIIYEADLDLNLTYVNSVAYKKFGYTPEDLDCGLNIAQLIDPKYKDKAFSKIKLIFEGKETKPDDYLMCKKEGSTFYARIHSRPIFKEGNIIGLRGTVTDINDMMISEQELRESEEKFRGIAEQSFMSIIVLQEGLMKFFNDRVPERIGYTREEIKNWKPYEFMKAIHPEDRDFVLEQAKKKQAGEEDVIHQYRYRLIRKDGGIKWVENFSKTINYKGSPADLIMSVDITDKIHAEQKLKESEEKFRTIAEQSLMGICIIQDFEIKYLNQQMADIYGYSLAEIKVWKPKEFIKVFHPDYKEMVIDQITKKQHGATDAITHYIAKIIRKNGIIRWVENYSKPITYKGHPADLLTQVDITAKMNAEQKLRTSEEKYRHLYESSPNAILLINMKGEIIDCNLISEKLSGFKRSELIGMNFMNMSFIPEKYIPFVIEDFKVLIKEKVIEPREIQLYTKEGIPKWVLYQGSIFNIENEKIIQVIIQNIDQKKKGEQKIKESEEKYRSLFENMNAGFAYHKVIVNDNDEPIDYKYLEVNPGFEKLTGLKKEDLIGKTVTEAIPGTENDPADWIGKFGKVGITGIPLIVEDYSEAFDRWYKVSGYSPKKGYFAVTFTDITDRKKAEEKLKESEAKYHELFETSPDGVILTDIKGKILECNSAIEQITGYSPRDFIGKNYIKIEIYHKNGLEILLKGYKDLLGENQLGAVELPIKCKDNQIKWIEVRSTLINMKGQLYILAVIHDTTTQKQAEEALKESEEKFRDLLETSSVGVMELDVINKKLTYINPKLLDIIGFDKEELTEEVFRDYIIHPLDLIKLLRSNEESELEFRVTDKMGKLKWLSGKRIPHYNENGEISSIRVWLDDITEKKMYEELIYELNINFLNFTADIKKNLQLLLNTCLKLLNGDLILYYQKNLADGKELYQVLTSDNKIYSYDFKDLTKDHFINKLFSEDHDFPQTFIDIDKMEYAKSDPFIIDHKFKGCFGKLIKSHSGLKSAVCIFYKDNPIISGQDKLVLFLICDAIEIEQRRWRVQRDLEKQNITLDKINKLKTELFSRTSHELKTPLISVKGFTELLLTLYKSKLDPEVTSILEEIKDGSKRLEKIINMLLESTKLEAGQLELNLKEEDLTFLIKFCVKELQGLSKLRNQTISLNLHDKLETNFDKERIYEVISNLLVNAIKYTPPDGKISIQSEINNDFYIISIKDNGIGFSEEEKSQVFKQFGKIERYGQGWDIAADGTGLGLYITKKLVELHGGKIWLESGGRNKGSTFYFSIPNK